MNTREIAAEYRLAHWAQIMQERKSVLPKFGVCVWKTTHPSDTISWKITSRGEDMQYYNLRSALRDESGMGEMTNTEEYIDRVLLVIQNMLFSIDTSRFVNFSRGTSPRRALLCRPCVYGL